MARLIISGWAGHVRVLANGRKQIIATLLPGDLIDLRGPVTTPSRTLTVALSPLRTIPARELQAGKQDRAADSCLAAALEHMAAEEDFFLIEQIVRLGRQTAYERIGSWLMEVDYRLSARGLSRDGQFLFPLTQEVIADIAGLSVVHVNRVLQQMRREGLIELRSGWLKLLDRSALANAGEFIAPGFSSDASGMPRSRAHAL